MKQQENMILNKLNQYKNLYLQVSNENAHLKHAISKHEDELKANRKTIESMDCRILELEEELIEAEQNERSACWFHARHYFVDAFIADHRVRTIIKLMNYLFYIERVANEKNKRGKAR